MSDLNNVTMIGRLTKDPEVKYTASGTSVCSFSIANNRKFKDKDETSFFNCIAWSKTGETIAQYVKKGQRIGIEGHIVQRTYEAKDGSKRSTVEIVVNNFQFLTPKAGEADEGAKVIQAQFGGEVPF